MKSKILIAFIVSIFALTFFSTISFADEIILKNGDRLSGKLVSMEEGKLIFNTSYAGDITVNWSEIKTIKTDGQAAILLNNGSLIKGALQPTKDNKVMVDTSSSLGTPPLDLGEVAAINPELLPQEVKLTGRADVAIALRSGNTDTSTYNLSGEIQARSKKSRYTLGGEYNREEDHDKTTVNNWLAYAKYDHFLTEKLYGYVNTVFEKDKMADLNLRSSIGLGLGYQVWESEKTNLALEAGLSYVNEDYDVGSDSNYAAFRWSVDFDRYIWDDFLQFFHFHEGTIGLEDTSDITIRSRTGLRMPLKNGFSANMQYNWDWDNTPAPGKDSVDEAFIVGLGYEF